MQKLNISLKSLKVEGFEFEGNISLSDICEGETNLLVVSINVNKVKTEGFVIEGDFEFTYSVDYTMKNLFTFTNAIFKMMQSSRSQMKDDVRATFRDLESKYDIDLTDTISFFENPVEIISKYLESLDSDCTEDSGSEAEGKEVIFFIDPVYDSNLKDNLYSWSNKSVVTSNTHPIEDIKHALKYFCKTGLANSVLVRFHDGSEATAFISKGVVYSRSGIKGSPRRRRPEDTFRIPYYTIEKNNGIFGDIEAHSTWEVVL